MKRLITLIFTALVFIATPVQAADEDGMNLPCCIKGMYFSGNIGATFLADSDFRFLGAEVVQTSHDPGFNIGGAYCQWNFGLLNVDIS